MKVKFTTLDIKILIAELNQKLQGMRVNNVYDIDSKTYLIKLNRTDKKAVLLLESGIRLHTTEFEWPKNLIPSGFAMKLRKHLRGRRLENVSQLGVDRIVDMQFGSGEAAYHVILEMYDRGNIVLTDYEYTILNIQRPRTDNNQDVKFIVKEKYPLYIAKQHEGVPEKASILEILESAKKGDNLKKILNPHLVYGGHLLEHCLMEVGLQGTARIGTEFQMERDLDQLMGALNNAEDFMEKCCEHPQNGYIIHQEEKKSCVSEKSPVHVLIYLEFHPFLFKQHENEPHIKFESFDKAIDEFFSKIENQKQDRKLMQQETAAVKKLEHIKMDNQVRIKGLKEEQLNDLKKAWLIELNLDLVEEALHLMRNALAHQLDWTELKLMMEEAGGGENPVVDSIKTLKLDINHINMLLKPPENFCIGHDAEDKIVLTPMKVDIDLGISAYANARKHYDMKRHAANKEVKTSDALQKAYKSVEKKTMQVLKDVQTVATINKARKTHWFEKFLWFISSENYVIIGGRDQQQNEFIVKRYFKPGDIYVHADLHGASSVVIKNPSKNSVPPVTLNEAGTMALCNSAAWDARVVTSSWWVYHDQVSKTAPTGEYLTTGSFMIRGKKNYLLPSNLIYGFGFLFKLDETCVEKHKNERRVKGKNDEDEASVSTSTAVDVELEESNDDDDDDVIDGMMESDESTRSLVKNLHEMTVKNDADEKVPGAQVHENVGDSDDEEDDEAACERDGGDLLKDVGNMDEAFPDTQIRLDHLTSVSSDVQLPEEESISVKTHPRMSAKQRRNAKKETRHVENEISKTEGTSQKGEGTSQKGERTSQKGEGTSQKGEGTSQKGERTSQKGEGTSQKGERTSQKGEGTSQKGERTSQKGEGTSQKGERTSQKGEGASQKGEGTSKITEGTSEKADQQNASKLLKRGQKSKMKKIKEKYGDQDDDERQLRMQLLASDRGPKEDKSKKKSKATAKHQLTNQKIAGKTSTGVKHVIGGQRPGKVEEIPVTNNPDDITIESGLVEEELEQDDETNKQMQQETEMLDSLTGIPHPDDILLYCIPVCAPWNALQNYRFKVKLAPGTCKRGKAAKMTVSTFMKDKSTSPLERDLLRSVKDTDLSRNMPGKVKVSITKSQIKK